jgi:LysM repeat protein
MRFPLNGTTRSIPGRFYVVQYSDNLFTIAQRFNTSIDEILAFNPQLGSLPTPLESQNPGQVPPPVVYAGEILFIPTSTVSTNRRRKKRLKR